MKFNMPMALIAAALLAISIFFSTSNVNAEQARYAASPNARITGVVDVQCETFRNQALYMSQILHSLLVEYEELPFGDDHRSTVMKRIQNMRTTVAEWGTIYQVFCKRPEQMDHK